MEATQFACLSVVCLALLMLSWHLLRDSVETFEGAVPDANRMAPTTWTGQLRMLAETALFVAAAAAAGLWLCARVGIRPLALPGDNWWRALALILGQGVLWGLAVSLAYDAPRYVLFRRHVAKWDEEVCFASWRKYLGAALGAGVGEELVFRLLLFPLLAWLFGFAARTPEGLPTTSACWAGLILATLVFAATHVPIVEDLGGYTPPNVLRAMAVFCSPGLVLGLVFWRCGLETVVTAHASGLLIGWFYVSVLRWTRARRREEA